VAGSVAAPVPSALLVRAIVVSCLEPFRLDASLRALRLWLPADAVVVLNNANTRLGVAEIDSVACDHGIATLRIHTYVDRRSTIDFIHEGLQEVCRAYPDDVVLKIDEDVLFATDRSRVTPGERQFLVPALTINNYTTRQYLDALWPELAARVAGNGWMWHLPHPATGDDAVSALAAAIYSVDPVVLAEAARADGRREVIGAADYEAKCLMPARPGVAGYRGISSTAIAFRARDYLELFGDCRGVEEVLIGDAVHAGEAEYVVDHGMFGHHVNYFTVRDIVGANTGVVDAYNERVLEYFAAVHAGRIETLPPWRAEPFGPDPS